jgi:hypothetical protein
MCCITFCVNASLSIPLHSQVLMSIQYMCLRAQLASQQGAESLQLGQVPLIALLGLCFSQQRPQFTHKADHTDL